MGNIIIMITKKRVILFIAALTAILLYFCILFSIYRREGPYNVLIQPEEKNLQVELTGERLQTSVGIWLQNRATRAISSEGNIFLSYHLEDTQKKVLQFDNVRTEIGAVAPNGKQWADMQIDVPEQPGEYKLVLDLVEEGVTWFSERANPCAQVFLTVTEPVTGEYNQVVLELTDSGTFAGETYPQI